MQERGIAGFIPDLREGVKCEYFYKSFFRDPYLMRLYLGQIAKWFNDSLIKYAGQNLTVLDVGCGPGIVSLEIARNGHHVTGIDISEKSLSLAKKALNNNYHTDNFGSLQYALSPFEEIEGTYDAIVFSGSLHHFSNIDSVITKSRFHLKKEGLILCYEPWHEKWTMQDAAIVALLRLVLSITGYWYETYPELSKITGGNFDAFTDEIHREYLIERDKNEPGGQSPHDNDSTGDEIIAALNEGFHLLEFKPGFSFIYRFLGGIRGPDQILQQLADLFTAFDQYSVERGYMNPNAFFYVGRKR
ncbi:MAG: class I SAM-dependent methyltransferase [Sulfuricellaceae bacterium]|nr:class I SAM-dependent methyltransferase [Sulfuricellaceae bacterium]